jgi:hypothetical protein
MGFKTTHILAAIGLTAALLVGCRQDGPAEACQPGALCSFDELPRWEQTVPGFSAQVAPVDGRFWVAARSPESGDILVGTRPEASDEGPRMRILASTDSEGMALDGSLVRDRAAVAWVDRQGRLFVAVGGSDGWRRSSPIRIRGSADPIAATGDLDIAVADGELLHVVVRDQARDALVGLTGVVTNRNWSLRVIDNGAPEAIAGDCRSVGSELDGQIGYNPSLLRTRSRLLVSYYDALCGNLRMAQRTAGTGTNWGLRLIDTGDVPLGERFEALPGDVGRASSMARGADGTIGIAYQDAARGRLMYAEVEPDEVTRSVVDPGLRLDHGGQREKRIVGAFPSLVFDGQSRPRIAYLDGTRAKIKLADRRPVGPGVAPRPVWLPETLALEAPVGFSTHLARGAGGSELLVAEALRSGSNGIESTMIIEGDP